MQVFLLGHRSLDFVGSDGNEVKGTQLHVAFNDDGVTGQAVDTLFVKPEIAIPKGLEVGKTFNVYFNRRGKVESLSI